MTGQTTLSAATLAPAGGTPRARPRAPMRGRPKTVKFLIANLELEFRPTHRKISPLRISNRKYLAIFHLTSQARRRATSPNIQGGNLLGYLPLAQLRTSNPLTPHRASSLSLSLATRHSLPATAFLIYGAAIRNRRNSLTT
jgi:hypothetical protein